MTDRDWIALTLWGEARGENTAGRLAVASVLTNRAKSGRWGETYEAVVTAPKQFSCWNPTDPNRAELDEWMADLAASRPVSDTILLECYWIADGVLQGVLTPQVGHAMWYYAGSLAAPPKWALTAEFVRQVGQHRFFQNVV